MRPVVILVVAGLAAVAACSKSGGGHEIAPVSAAASPPAAEPAVLTDAQKTALLSTLPAAYQHADLDNGQAKFALCKSCHTVVQGGSNMTGPNLWGIFGRKAGSAPGFAYSDGLKATGIVWDADKIDQWITNPRKLVPSTKMTYAGMENPKDRIDVIAYLKTVTSAPPS